MKQKYEEANVEIIELKDIVTTSGFVENDDGGNWSPAQLTLPKI